MTLEEQLRAARAEGAEMMRALCAGIDPYVLHRKGAPFAHIIDSPASLIQIMQDGIWALPNPFAEAPPEDQND